MWYPIQNHINEKLNQHMEKKYKNPKTNTQYYSRVINKTDIQFSKEEMSLLDKGLKYNLTHKGKHWLSNLAL
jgi:hypothetical protein